MTTKIIKNATLQLTISLAEVEQLRAENANFKTQVLALQNQVADLQSELESLKKQKDKLHDKSSSKKKRGRSAMAA